jgi:DNA-directed RNA polymerase specialized sigma subunit
MKRKNATTKSIRSETKTYKNNSNQKYGEVSYYAGIPEWEGWVKAPLIPRDIFYFKINSKYNLEQLKLLLPDGEIAEPYPCKIKLVVSPKLNLTSDEIRRILNRDGLQVSDMKSFRNIKRRNLNLLPPEFLKAVVEENSRYIQKLIYRKYASQVSQIIESSEDIQGLAVEIVLELAESFDTKSGAPFASYVAIKLPNKLIDKARTINGRTLNNFASRLNKILDSGATTPLQPEEISRLMKIPHEIYERRLQELGELRSIQNPASLNAESETRDNENAHLAAAVIQVESPEEAYLREEAICEVRESFYEIADKFAIVIPSNSIPSATVCQDSLLAQYEDISDKEQKRIQKRIDKILIGMKAVYLRHWDEMDTAEISRYLGYPVSAIKTSELAYQDELRKHLGDT